MARGEIGSSAVPMDVCLRENFWHVCLTHLDLPASAAAAIWLGGCCSGNLGADKAMATSPKCFYHTQTMMSILHSSLLLLLCRIFVSVSHFVGRKLKFPRSKIGPESRKFFLDGLVFGSFSYINTKYSVYSFERKYARKNAQGSYLKPW